MPSLSLFIRQKAYERIERKVRRHLITFVPYILLTLVLLAMPIVLRELGLQMFPNLTAEPVTQILAILGASIYYLSVAIFFYGFFVSFYLDLLVITNDRLVDIEQQTLFSRTINELDLHHIQDASSEIKGFWATVFNYGDIHVETAGAQPKFLAHNVPRPNELRRYILDLAAQDKIHHNKQP